MQEDQVLGMAKQPSCEKKFEYLFLIYYVNKTKFCIFFKEEFVSDIFVLCIAAVYLFEIN
jgi:hypothetical protein